MGGGTPRAAAPAWEGGEGREEEEGEDSWIEDGEVREVSNGGGRDEEGTFEEQGGALLVNQREPESPTGGRICWAALLNKKG